MVREVLLEANLNIAVTNNRERVTRLMSIKLDSHI